MTIGINTCHECGEEFGVETDKYGSYETRCCHECFEEKYSDDLRELRCELFLATDSTTMFEIIEDFARDYLDMIFIDEAYEHFEHY